MNDETFVVDEASPSTRSIILTPKVTYYNIGSSDMTSFYPDWVPVDVLAELEARLTEPWNEEDYPDLTYATDAYRCDEGDDCPCLWHQP
jgi:hypothetical protein